LRLWGIFTASRGSHAMGIAIWVVIILVVAALIKYLLTDRNK
jgi:hypothetical protein